MSTTLLARSPGLAYLQTAADAMEPTLTSEQRIWAMDDLMQIAITYRFRFDLIDGPALKRLAIFAPDGGFLPLHERYYAAACSHGSSYAPLWEAQTGFTPWFAARALSLPLYFNTNVLPNNRVATGMGLLLPAPIDATDDPEFACYENSQVWWCTGFQADRIHLARYRVREGRYRFKDGRRWPFARDGKPAITRQISRGDWNILNATQATLPL